MLSCEISRGDAAEIFNAYSQHKSSWMLSGTLREVSQSSEMFLQLQALRTERDDAHEADKLESSSY